MESLYPGSTLSVLIFTEEVTREVRAFAERWVQRGWTVDLTDDLDGALGSMRENSGAWSLLLMIQAERRLGNSEAAELWEDDWLKQQEIASALLRLSESGEVTNAHVRGAAGLTPFDLDHLKQWI